MEPEAISEIGVLSRWIDVKREGLTFDRLYDYWILGIDHTKKPRWSVIRNVLGWVK